MADKLTIIEDEGAEQLAREGEFELAIPFSLYLYNDGGIRINVFPSLKKDAEEFLSLFPDDRMFSPEALGWARERFGGAISAEGKAPPTPSIHGRSTLWADWQATCRQTTAWICGTATAQAPSAARNPTVL